MSFKISRDYPEELARDQKERRRIAEMVAGSLDSTRILEELKRFEKKRGHLQVRVEVRVDNPGSLGWATQSCGGSASKEFGSFDERAIVVKRIAELEPEYLQDLQLVEGEYESLRILDDKIYELNLLYHSWCKGRIEEIYNLVGKHFNKEGELFANSLAHNLYIPDPKDRTKDIEGYIDKDRLPQDEVFNFLEKQGFRFLRHNVVAKPDGVYDDRTSYGGSISVVDMLKIADVSLKLL